MTNLKKNVVYNFIYQVLVLILPFITAPYISRVIGAGGIGTYSLAQSIAQYFTYFTLLGLINYGNRTIASVQDDIEKRSKAFSEIYVMQIICFVISIVVYVAYALFFSVDMKAASIMGIWVISALFDINWLFFGAEQFKLTIIRNATTKLLTVFCIFLFVKDQYDVYVYLLIMAIGALVSQVILWPFLKNFVHFTFPKFLDVRKHFKPNLILFVPVIAVSIYKIMDKVMLGYMCTTDELGYYENAEKIITMLLTLITAIGTVMLPRMTALISKNKLSESKEYIDKTMFWVTAYVNAAMFGLFVISEEFAVIYYGEEFKKTGIIMCYLAVTLIFVGCGNVIRTQFLIPQKRDMVYIYSAILGAMVNLFVNLALIPKYSSIGAAIGTICAEIAVYIFQVFSIRKEIAIFHYLKYELAFFIMGVVMYATIKAIPTLQGILFDIIVRIVVGIAIYGVLVIAYIIILKKCHKLKGLF